MGRFRTNMQRYPIVVATVLVAVLVVALLLTGHATAAQWLASAFALGAAGLTSVGMVRDIMRGNWGIDILAVTAIVATVSVGEYLASLVIVLMLSGGEALEDYAGGRARRELTSLLARSPQTAHRYTSSTAEIIDVPVGEVRIGDTLLVRPAEVVPVDGALTSGEAALDQSALTGESLPVQVTTGDRLLSGSVNGGNALTMRATARVEDSQYQRIVALVEEASQSRAPLVRLADRYAVPFTVASLLIAGLAWYISGDPTRFAEVLVVATPCPLLIAAPVAFMGGMSRAARSGIIVKSGGTLEKLSRARTVVFDKTGTLTQGQPSLEAVHPAGNWSEDDVLSAAASAEQYSTHVLADSVRQAALHRGLEPVEATGASEHATNGVVADLPVGTVVVGKRSFVARFIDDVPHAPLPQGHVAVWVAIDGTFAGTLVLSDRLRHNAAATVAAFRSMGADEAMMVTGDLRSTRAGGAHPRPRRGFATGQGGHPRHPETPRGDGRRRRQRCPRPCGRRRRNCHGSPRLDRCQRDGRRGHHGRRSVAHRPCHGHQPAHHEGGAGEHLAGDRAQRRPDAGGSLRLPASDRRRRHPGDR